MIISQAFSNLIFEFTTPIVHIYFISTKIIYNSNFIIFIIYGFIILVCLILVYIMLQKFEIFKKNKDKNINKTKVEYNLYNFSIQTIYTGH